MLTVEGFNVRKKFVVTCKGAQSSADFRTLGHTRRYARERCFQRFFVRASNC